MTALEFILKESEYLTARGIASPRLEVEWMLAHLLDLPRLQLYLQFDRTLTAEVMGTARTWVRRRAAREPLQHILGTTEFCGLTLQVGPEALIPRPETEQLTELVLGSLRGLGRREPRLLDFGTGTGCILVALAVALPSAVCHGVDVSDAALALARTNAARHGVQDRILFHLGDGFAALPPDIRFDMIVANPPYIPTAEIEHLEPEVRDHDPHEALDGGPDGLDYFRRLAGEGREWMAPAGSLWMEMGEGQSREVASLFQAHNWVVDAPQEDYSRRVRFLQVKLSTAR